MPFFLVCLVGLLVSIRASLASSPVVSGQVRLPDGSAVVGAQVVLFDVADLRRGPVGQATTDEAGTFALPLTAANRALALPQEVGLGQNYPNPFNPSTLIPYQLATPAPVRLEVFNLLGQRVATLVDGQQAAGAYVARWDGTDALGRAAASGVYFYRLTVAGAHWTGKMVLVDGQAGVPLGGARVTMVSMADGSSGRYGLVVSAAGLATYVDSDFIIEAGPGPVDMVVSAEPNRRGKVVASLEGLLGDVNADERVDLDDGLLVAMYSVDPSLALPHHGLMTLGDVNCDGRVELEDAGLLATYVANPSASAVASLRIGQPGGYSLDPVTEVVWGSILGTEQSDATVAQILDEVPVLLSGVLSVGADDEDRLYLGIDRAYWTEQGGKQLYEALKQRFPATPIHVEPSIGVVHLAGKVRALPTTTALRQVAPVTQFGPPMSFTESPNAALPDHSKAQHVVGTIDVPHDVVVGSVSVAVDISHTARNDLIVELVAPSGVVVPLYRGIRHGVSLADDLVGTIATTDALQGQPAQGTWQIRVGDYGQNDTGTVNAWTLTVTPAEDGGVTEEPVNVLLETFQDGLNDWSTTAWEAAALDTDTGIPGEGAGNIVAKTEGCSICFLTLKTPVDLSDHDEVTLSFYRWMDPGTMSNEFLGIDVANNGQYQRLKTWNRQHADGQWHLETFTLSGDQIGESFTIRFFGITHNMFTTFAVDNVMIAAAPGSVVVTPDTPSMEEPDLAVTETTARPATVAPQERLSLETTIQNSNAAAGTQTITIYRHTQITDTPKQGGAVTSIVGAILQTDATRSIRTTTSAPETPGTYYYYSCISELENEENVANNCVETPATVAVSPKPQTPQTPNYDDLPMGGDWINVSSPSNPDFSNAGTITLGGLETTTGVQGFVVSAHVVAPPGPDGLDDYTNTDAITGHRSVGGTFRDLLGKVFRMPKLQRREGAQTPLLTADAAFVAYPHPGTPDCSYTYKEYDQFSRGREYCLDVGSGEYLERIAPLRVRGADNAVHPVIGSAASTEGLTVQFFGARSGEALRATVETVRLLTYGRNTVQYVSVAFETLAQGGDSGAPVYTVPDAAGNVRIVGILHASTVTGEGDNRREGITFSTWSDVEAALDLKPLSAPASAGPTEDDLASLFSAFD